MYCIFSKTLYILSNRVNCWSSKTSIRSKPYQHSMNMDRN
jgi:hypothetical protein